MRSPAEAGEPDGAPRAPLTARSIPPVIADAAAAYRLTRLVTADTLTQPIRERIIEAAYVAQARGGEARASIAELGAADDPDRWQRAAEQDPRIPRIAELITCRWCAGMWVSLGITLIARRTRWWAPIRDALALSAVAALAASLED